MEFKEKHYSIDPGEGKKMEGCPYSTFEDGHDVKDFIIPPKGYTFKGFRFDPTANNQIYDGKLIAEFEKEPFNEKLMSNLWKVGLVVAIIAIIGVIVWLAVSLFKDPKSPNHPNTPKVEEVKPTPADTITQVDTVSQKAIADTLINEKVDENETIKEIEAPSATETDPNVQFKEEFWTLIHERTIMMDPYHDLYVKYKDQASGEEFEYLRLTILQDFAHFKKWYAKLKLIPANELESITTVESLKNKLEEYNNESQNQ